VTKKLKIHFAIWIILSITVAIGGIAADISWTPIFASLTLRPGESINVPVFRVLPEKIRIELGFKNTTPMRPELGSHVNLNGQKRRDALEFPNPGEPIKLLLRSETRELICEAWPGSSFSGGGERTGRELVPYVDDRDPNLFPLPSNPTRLLDVPMGESILNISVLEVGKSITGESVDVLIHAPITWKHISPNYGFLSWFSFWPIYVLILAIYGAVLMHFFRRQSKDSDKQGRAH
jgi:hypothetical protein